MNPKTLPVLLAVLAAGCAAPGVDTRGKDGAPPKFFTPIATQSRWTVPAELEGTDSVIVAFVDLDFSKRDTEIVCTPASFRPNGNTIRLAIFEEGRRVRTIAALRDALAERTDGTPIALVVAANGEALGAGAQITPAMQQFLAYFVDQLDKAGVEFTILAPDRLSVVRSRGADDPADDAEPDAAPAAAPPARTRSAVYDIPVQ
jgi:hypothetical protein